MLLPDTDTDALEPFAERYITGDDAADFDLSYRVRDGPIESGSRFTLEPTLPPGHRTGAEETYHALLRYLLPANAPERSENVTIRGEDGALAREIAARADHAEPALPGAPGHRTITAAQLAAALHDAAQAEFSTMLDHLTDAVEGITEAAETASTKLTDAMREAITTGPPEINLDRAAFLIDGGTGPREYQTTNLRLRIADPPDADELPATVPVGPRPAVADTPRVQVTISAAELPALITTPDGLLGTRFRAAGPGPLGDSHYAIDGVLSRAEVAVANSIGEHADSAIPADACAFQFDLTGTLYATPYTEDDDQDQDHDQEDTREADQ